MVAALAGQGGVGFGGAATQLLTEDVVAAGPLQVAAVLRRGEPAVTDPHHPGQLPGPQIVFDLADQGRVVGVARPAPHPHRDPSPGDGHPDDHLGQIRAVVLGAAPRAEPDRGALGGLIGGLGLEVGGGGVEEQQVDFEVQQVRGGPVDGLGQVVFDLQQPVHGPIQRLGVLAEVAETGDDDIGDVEDRIDYVAL